MSSAKLPDKIKLPGTGKSQYRWLWRTLGIGPQFKRTPLPPKPYEVKQDSNLIIRERGYEEHIGGVDPEKPHWRDPKFESREKTPIFDFFGFNRNYSYSLFKLSTLVLVGLFFKESQSMFVLQDNALQLNAKTPTPDPEWARDDVATERELRAAGFALVGYKKLDNVGVREAANKARGVAKLEATAGATTGTGHSRA
jgi:hypothetical protein